MDVLKLMAAPFVECLVLVSIHSYLGLHVIRRRIIFVDLALAQIAALGATVGFIFGIDSGTTGCFFFSLTFCVLGAALFASTRMRSDRVPQEAVIGLVYAIIAALSILVIHKTKGADHLEDILVGNLLWVSWSDVASAAIAYAVIGAIHFAFRKQFLLISDAPDEAYARGMYVRMWDFLFYATFGMVITFSVRVAGVLLVFVFLVAPAILAVMLTTRFFAQLLVGWIAGTLVTVMGLYLSYALDLPSGPTVVSFYGFVLVGTAVVLAVLRSSSPRRALAWAGGAAALVGALGWGLFEEGKLLAAIGGEAHARGEHAAQAVSARERAAAEDERSTPEETMQQIRRARANDAPRARALLLRLLEGADTPPFYREQAAELLQEMAGQRFEYRPEEEPAANREALERIRAWSTQRKR